MISGMKVPVIALSLFCAVNIPLPANANKVSAADGRALFNKEFNPQRYFGFDYDGVRPDGSMGVEELILTAQVSARDDYLPEYALAIAYTCETDTDKENSFICGYTARMLRVKADQEGSVFGSALKLTSKVKKARGKRARAKAFRRADVEWLESDLITDCKPAIDVMDKLATKADWKPNLHYTRVKREDRELILHPAQMWITMKGNDQISRWQGWRNADGAAYGIRLLIEELDKCWKPSKAPAPWR